MLTDLRKSLLMSAAARNLAVDLVREHGADALDIVDRALSIADRERPCDVGASENERMLTASRSHIMALVELLPDAAPPCRRSEAEREDAADTLARGSR